MSEATWHFRPKRPSDTARDPISSEFFADESVEDAARALVRESIQNSLDAHDKAGSHPVEVRITLRANGRGALPSAIAPFFSAIWPHVSAASSGLSNPPDPRERCSFLTIEDFGTSGLEGDPLGWIPKHGKTNSFYTFFRAEAYSEKEGDDRGRWGVGKLVFPRASRAHAFFGLTVPRSTEQPLLMGRMLLPHHDVDGVTYLPDAIFGIRQTVDGDDQFVAPCTNLQIIQAFREAFSVERRNEPGLSIVVPWLDEEEVFTSNEVAGAVAAEYMLPILRGDLIVTVSDGVSMHRLDPAALLRPSQHWLDESLHSLVSLGQFASQVQPNDVIHVARAEQANAPKWPEHPLSAEAARSARDKLERGQPVAFQLPLIVTPKEGRPSPACFRVHFLEAETSATNAPVFIREGITITNACGTKVPGLSCLVTIDDRALATLLGDAENPAHTEWRPNTRGFKQKYKYAKAYLDYVRGAPANLFKSLFGDELEEDRFALGTFFPDNRAVGDPRSDGGATRNKKRTFAPPPGTPPLPRKPRPYGLRKVSGGFEVTRGEPETERPAQLLIQAAYDVRQGDPLKRYEYFDFDFSSAEMLIHGEGVSLTRTDKNLIVARITADDFRIRVTGFDANRDVYVRVRVQERDDGR